MKFSPIYYTRYHLWQNLVSALGEKMPSSKEMGDLAKTGLDFIMGDGNDIWEEEREGTKGKPEQTEDGDVVVDFRGAYL